MEVVTDVKVMLSRSATHQAFLPLERLWDGSMGGGLLSQVLNKKKRKLEFKFKHDPELGLNVINLHPI